jgi:transposase
LQRQYKSYLSQYQDWEFKKTAQKGLVFHQNIGEFLSIDETSLSHGELYTLVTNKEQKGKKGTLVAIIEGTKAENVIAELEKIPIKLRKKVKEITLDLAPNMALIAKRAFPNAVQVTDRFHVQQLATEALQEIRIKHRWQAIDAENEAIEQAKINKKKYNPELLSNGDTIKQLLARSRYVLYKSQDNWTQSQKERADLLFEKYPDIKQAYGLTRALSDIFSKTKDKIYAYTRLAKWYEMVDKSGFKSFNTISKTIMNNYTTILNYFDNKSTNASAESFNAKIKAFRSQFRGVNDVNFFLFRIANLFA